ncbi:hypothetical protein AGMMS49959_09940 [Planctomycetales bacterium]|nr:hypothetical protein AGMMS49959_09940 [Planctomycetales bacterium]
MVFQIGVEPRRIDIITEISGVDFREAYPRALTTDLDGMKIKVLSLQDLLANKRACGRLQDLADVEMLERHLAAGRLPR